MAAKTASTRIHIQILLELLNTGHYTASVFVRLQPSVKCARASRLHIENEPDFVFTKNRMFLNAEVTSYPNSDMEVVLINSASVNLQTYQYPSTFHLTAHLWNCDENDNSTCETVAV